MLLEVGVAYSDILLSKLGDPEGDPDLELELLRVAVAVTDPLRVLVCEGIAEGAVVGERVVKADREEERVTVVDREAEMLRVPVGLPVPLRDSDGLAVTVLDAGCDRVPMEVKDAVRVPVTVFEVVADPVVVLEELVELVGFELTEGLRDTEGLPVPLREAEDVLDCVDDREPFAD